MRRRRRRARCRMPVCSGPSATVTGMLSCGACENGATGVGNVQVSTLSPAAGVQLHSPSSGSPPRAWAEVVTPAGSVSVTVMVPLEAAAPMFVSRISYCLTRARWRSATSAAGSPAEGERGCRRVSGRAGRVGDGGAGNTEISRKTRSAAVRRAMWIGAARPWEHRFRVPACGLAGATRCRFTWWHTRCSGPPRSVSRRTGSEGLRPGARPVVSVAVGGVTGRGLVRFLLGLLVFLDLRAAGDRDLGALCHDGAVLSGDRGGDRELVPAQVVVVLAGRVRAQDGVRPCGKFVSKLVIGASGTVSKRL